MGEWALKRTALFLSLLALVVVSAPVTLQAATINVTAGAVDTSVNGNCSLIEAIQSANTNSAVDTCTAGSGADIIVIPAGTYTLTVVASMTAAGASGLPAITSDITLQGADAATTIIERSAAMGTPDFRHLQNLSTLTVTGVTLTNGSDAVVGGGAIYNGPAASLTIADSVFSDNTATTEGGAIAADNTGAIVITDTTFMNNSSTDGGAIAHGTLLSGATGSIACTRCLFSGNTATGSAGAILASGTNLTLTDSLVAGNTAAATSAGGGLFTVQSAVAQISGTTFSGNAAGLGAGFAVGNSTTATIVNSTFSGNMATDASIGGGGVLANGVSLTLNNVTITGNSSGAGGGLSVAGNVTFANTVIAGNSATGTGPDCSIQVGALTSMGFNLVGNNTGCNFTAATGDQVGTGATPIDPLLGALTDNGGPTPGATPTAIPTHFPQPGSPVLDAGNNVNAIGGAFPACPAADQRNVARPLGPRCDIGAVESSTDADVAITKADSPDPVTRGSNLTYTLTVTNNGPGGAGTVQVVDNLPAGLTFVSATPSQGTCIEAALMVTCNLGILASGGSATIGIVVTTTAAGMLTNTATVTTASNDPDLSNNSDTETTVVNPVTDISVTKTAGAGPINVGDNITYTITVTNNGPDNATGVSLMDQLPASVNFVSATPSQGMCAQAAGLVTCNLGALANGSSATVSIVVTTTANAVITNTVTVTADGADLNPANNQASQTTSVGRFADLILSMTEGTDPVPISTNLVYTLTVANIGPDQATGVTLVDTLPANTTFQSASIGTGSCAHSMGVVTCNIGNIAAAASVTATITIQGTVVGVITNTANVTLTEADPNTSNNSAMVSTTVVDFTISVAPASVTVTLGNSGSYTVTLMPVGGRFDNSVGLSCTSPPTGVTCVFQPASPAPGGATITSALTVRTTAGSSGAAPLEPPQAPPPIFIWLVVTAALLGWLTTRLVPALRGRLAALGVVLALLLMLGLQVACSNSEETAPPPTPIAGTPRGTHTITVRGNFGSLEHSATTMLVVQ